MFSPEYLEALRGLAGAIGPTAAVLLILVLVMAVGYRRDFLRKVNGLTDAHERRDRREERIAQGIEQSAVERGKGNEINKQLAESIAHLGDSMRRTEEQRARDTAEIIRATREAR